MNTNIHSLPQALDNQFLSLMDKKDIQDKELETTYQIEGWGSISVTMERIFDITRQNLLKELSQNGASICGSSKICTDRVKVVAPDNEEMIHFIKDHFNRTNTMIFGPPRRQFDIVMINGVEI